MIYWKVIYGHGNHSEEDRGYDEESLNGRDVKIDILDDYIRIPEEFRVVSCKNGVPEGLPEPPGGTNGPTWAL